MFINEQQQQHLTQIVLMHAVMTFNCGVLLKVLDARASVMRLQRIYSDRVVADGLSRLKKSQGSKL
jgi:hypothetical protein